jgi:hypothetical protein
VNVAITVGTGCSANHATITASSIGFGFLPEIDTVGVIERRHRSIK